MMRISKFYSLVLPLALLVPACKHKPTYNPMNKTGAAEVETESTETGTSETADNPSKDDSVATAATSSEVSIDQNPATSAEVPAADDSIASIRADTPINGSTAGVLSHGKGGLTGNQTLKSASGLKFMMNAPTDVHTSGKAYGVLVLLHGSTASNYTKFVGMMAGVAQKYNLIRVSVLAPNGQGWNEGGEVAAADALHALVQNEIIKKYNVDTSKILFSGQSSGAGFLSTNFVPQHAKDYQGGAFMLCGAAPPRVAFKPDAATKSRFKLHFEITTGDPIWPKSYAAALTSYTALGMQFTKDNTKPGGHCAFDQQKVILDHIEPMLGIKK